MNKRLVAVLLAGLACTPASAEELSATDKLINTQATRFHAAYNDYMETCIDLDEREQGVYELMGRLPSDCTRARKHYELQADILVRMMHGDQNSPAATE